MSSKALSRLFLTWRKVAAATLLVLLLLFNWVIRNPRWDDSGHLATQADLGEEKLSHVLDTGLTGHSDLLTSGMVADLAEATAIAKGPALRQLIIGALELQARLEATGFSQARDSLFNALASAVGDGERFNREEAQKMRIAWNNTVGKSISVYAPGVTWVSPLSLSTKPPRFPECTASVGMSQYGEDKLIFQKYFEKPVPLRNGIFFEMGGLDGWWLSNSYFFEQCLNWSGVLVEGHPDHFTKLRRHRTSPGTKRLWMAACDDDGGTISFASQASEISAALDQTTAEHKSTWSHAYGSGSIDVPCGPIGKYLHLMGVDRINFLSLDVEGAEMFVLQTFDWTRLAVQVLMVESPYFGESPIRDYLLNIGFNMEPEGTVPNSAVFVNRSFV